MTKPNPLCLPLLGSRVAVRALRHSDLPAFQRYRSDAMLARYQGWSAMTEPQALRFLAEMSNVLALVPGEWVQLGMALTDLDVLVGDIGLHLEPDTQVVEIGFSLDRAHQGRGVATEAVALIIDAVFASTPVGRVKAVSDARNAASIRLLERLGFAKVGEHPCIFKGEDCVEHVFEKLRPDAASDPP